MTSPSASIICYNHSENSGKHLLKFTSLLQIKNMIIDTDGQSDEELHRVRAVRVPNAGASIPLELGYTTLSACACVHQPRSIPNMI